MRELDYKELKNNGFIRQAQKDRFSLRIRVFGGKVGSEQLKKVYEIAHKYGEGYVHLTSRQSIEIPFIKPGDIEAVKDELAQAGLEPACCSPAVRTITACQGDNVCPSGLIDTTKIAGEFDKRYYAREMPHKFKIGITGCRNNCLKAEENDLGIKGGAKPEWVESKCRFCGLCQTACRSRVITIQKQDNKLYMDESKCELCGRCVKVCPAKAMIGKNGFVIYFGGTFGNRISIGRQLLPIIFTEAELHRVVEGALEFFKIHGRHKERFANTIERVGWDALRKKLERTVQEV